MAYVKDNKYYDSTTGKVYGASPITASKQFGVPYAWYGGMAMSAAIYN